LAESIGRFHTLQETVGETPRPLRDNRLRPYAGPSAWSITAPGANPEETLAATTRPSFPPAFIGNPAWRHAPWVQRFAGMAIMVRPSTAI